MACEQPDAAFGSLYTLPRRSVSRWTFTSAAAMAAQQIPLIVDGSPTRAWPAMQWTVPKLLQSARHEKLFWRSDSPLFRYQDTGQAMTETLLEHGLWRPGYSEYNMTLQDFVNYCSGRRDGRADRQHFYYTGDLRDEDGSVSSDLQPMEPLLPRRLDALDAGSSRANAWITCGGTVMHAHYDNAHNVFVHLLGENKTFFLLPPTATKDLHMAPKGHPNFRSSLIPDLARVDTMRFPRFAALREVFTAHLSPGDVLYLPPGWVHQVHAAGGEGSISVGVNIFSDGAESARAAYEAVEALPVPLEAAWPTSLRLAAVPALMARLLHGLHGGRGLHGLYGHGLRREAVSEQGGHDDGTAAFGHPDGFVREWVASRWRTLGAPAEGAAAAAAATDAASSPLAEQHAPPLLADCNVGHPQLTTPHFARRAADIARGFGRIHPPELRHTLLLNYFDTLVSFAVDWDARSAARLAEEIVTRCELDALHF
jgi:hypothetical protein